MNRRVAAVRAFFEYLVMTGAEATIRCLPRGEVRACAQLLGAWSVIWGQAAPAQGAGWCGSPGGCRSPCRQRG